MVTNKLNDKNFCSWIGTNKLKRARDVRELRYLLSDARTKDLFIKKGFNSAMEKLSIINPTATRGIYGDVEQLIDDLGMKVSPNDIIEMKENKSDERIKLLKQLQAKLESILELIK